MKKTITDTINKLLSKYLEDFAYPYDINCGECDEFAMDVIRKIQDGETENLCMIWIEDMIGGKYEHLAHAVIQWKSPEGYVYFDAECPEGTDDLDQLPLVKNHGKKREEVVNA